MTRTEVRAPLGDGADEVPDSLRDVVLAIVRDRPLAPVARITTERTVDVLYDVEGGAVGRVLRRPGERVGGVQRPRRRVRQRGATLARMGVGTGRGRRRRVGLLDRLANRLLDAGAVPAEHGSKLARVLGTTPAADLTAQAAADPVHRAVAEQVEQLLVWDRAVRADAYDSVHQMRVTTRKIRSLLQASGERSASPTTHGFSTNCASWPAVLGVARDAEVLAERYEQALDRACARDGARTGARATGRRSAAALPLGVATVTGRHALAALLPPARRA